MNNTNKAAAALLAAGLGAGAIVWAQTEVPLDKVEQAIEYRQNVMKAIGGLAGTSVGQIRDGFEHGPELTAVAAGLQALTRDIPSLFPEGSDFGETDAKSEIWEDWDTFEQRAVSTRDAVDAFAASVEQGDRTEMLRAFKDMGDACKACHEDFRKEQD